MMPTPDQAAEHAAVAPDADQDNLQRSASWWARFDLRRLPSLFGAGVVLAVLAKVFWTLARRLTFTPMSGDETCFLWAGWSLNRGLVPYRDFTDFKPPFVFFCNALALKLFGLHHQRYRYFFTLLVEASILCLAIALLRRRVNKLIVLTFALLIFGCWLDPAFHDSSLNDAESLGMAFYLLGVSSFLWPRAPRLAEFLGGVLMAISVLSKEPYALCVLATWATFVCMRYADSERTGAVRFVKHSLSGVALVGFSLIAYLALKGGLDAYLANLRRTMAVGDTVCVHYGVWDPSGTFLEKWGRRFDKLTSQLVNYSRLGAALPLLLAPFFLTGKRRIFITTFAVLAVLGSLYAVTLGGCFFRHYYLLGMAGLFFFMAVGALLLSRRLDQLPATIRRYAFVLIALFQIWGLWPQVRDELKRKYRAPAPLESEELLQFVKANSAPEDTIFTTGLPSLYLQTDRRHAAREPIYNDAFLAFYPGDTDEERVKPLYDELSANRPKIIIIDNSNAGQQKRFASALWMPFIEQHAYRKIDETRYVRPD
jgi:hypothetical protein